jgi:hypothetical protein
MTEEEANEMVEKVKGKNKTYFPKWSLIEVTVRGRELIWCLGALTSDLTAARIFKVKTQNLDDTTNKWEKEVETVKDMIFYPCVSVRRDGKSVYISG